MAARQASESTTSCRTAWFQAETRARVDELELVTPDTLMVGEEADAAATVVQDDTRRVRWRRSTR